MRERGGFLRGGKSCDAERTFIFGKEKKKTGRAMMRRLTGRRHKKRGKKEKRGLSHFRSWAKMVSDSF